MVTVYAVASAKGGVGKTTTTAAIATILADSGADVVAIDADLGMANLAEALGVSVEGVTLHDLLAGEASPREAVHEGPVGLRVVPGAVALDAYAAADPSGLREVVDAFEDADFVFIDAGAGLSHDSTLPLGLADETLLVSTPERSALGDTEKTRQLTERLGGSVAGAAITRLDPATAASDAPIDAVEQWLDAPVVGRIPEDVAVLRASESSDPLPLLAPDSAATRAYRDLTRTLTGATIPGPGLDSVDTEGEDETPTESESSDEGVASADEAAASTDDPDERETDEGADAAEPDEPEDTDDAGDEPDDADDDDAEDGEDIIVAEAERAGLGEPGDEEDIIVAAESPVETDEESTSDPEAEAVDPEEGTDAGVDDASDAESPAVDAVDGETETVGEGHVDGDDLEAMIESDLEPDAFDDETESAAAESEESDDTETDSATGRTPEQSDIDDELAGSVPFRDDDTGTMNTVLSDDDAEGDKADDDERDEDDDDGGFFSRLLGR
ncbi:P-loop NTPase [Halorubrum sp. PV6]|uniref:nucleotide-binding protein n=1 Tax=Halorubrum sp. PV6 TaxID=634157 RepID=UPI000F854669|nr:P-loop NTPase [Halorubrum sp. PV6]AZQ13592.1 cobyrinic acid ac-diamide synthase [Halorubrum sp. PV6]